MTTADNNPSGIPQGIPLNYGHQQPRWQSARAHARAAWSQTRAEWSRLREDSHQRFEQYWKSIGYFLGTIIYATGTPRQLIFAAALAFLAGGLALALEGPQTTTAPFWMWLGAFLLGLILPPGKPPSEK